MYIQLNRLKKNFIFFTITIFLLTAFLFSLPFPLYAIECTDYAYQKRPDLAEERPLGNAKEWADSARAKHFPVDDHPQVGDIVVFQPAPGISENGHVAYVEKVINDNSFYVSEANFQGGGTPDKPRFVEKHQSDQFIHRKPDLVVSDIKFYRPGTNEEFIPRAGQTVSFYAVLENNGGYKTGPYAVRWFLDGKEVGSGSNPDLAVNTCATNNVYFNWQATEGTHTVTFEADCYCAVYESKEDNNICQKEFNVNKRNFFELISDWAKNLWDNITNVFTVHAAELSTTKNVITTTNQAPSQVTTETAAPLPAPSKPSLTSPYNWYQSIGESPTLKWQGDSNSAYYYVLVNSSSTGNIESGWINSTSWKPKLPNENYVYSWKVKAKNSQGVEGPWSDEYHFSTASTNLKFEGDISFSPPSPSSADNIKIFASTTGWGGVGVTLRVSVNTAPDGSSSGEWKILKELGVPKFNENDAPVWDTKGWSNGTYKIRVEAKGPNDPNWQNPAVIETNYTLVNKAEKQPVRTITSQKEGFGSSSILDEEYRNKGELIYYPGEFGSGFIGIGFNLPEGTKIYSPFKGLAENNSGLIVFGGSGLYGFDILDASDPEWGWKHQRNYLFVGGGVRTTIEMKPSFTENPVEKGQAVAKVSKNQKFITPDGKEYDIVITFTHYDGDSNVWSYNEDLLNNYFHYK